MRPTTAADVRTAATGEKERVLSTITIAFSTDPVARWVFPEAAEFLTHFPEFARNFGGTAFTYDTAWCINGYAGAALWLPPGGVIPEEPILHHVRRSVPERLQDQILEIFDQMGRWRPEERHWYLPMIGVDTAMQGKGFGSALLRETLKSCDRDGLPAYLESSNPRNIPLYERHGFEVLGSIRAGSSPPIVPMLRMPR